MPPTAEVTPSRPAVAACVETPRTPAPPGVAEAVEPFTPMRPPSPSIAIPATLVVDVAEIAGADKEARVFVAEIAGVPFELVEVSCPLNVCSADQV